MPNLAAFGLDKPGAALYHARMTSNMPPHLLFQKLSDILDSLRRESFSNLSGSGQADSVQLTHRQRAVMAELKFMQEEGDAGVSLKALARNMQMTIAACSLLVEALVSKQLVCRAPNPADRRSVCISLTETGLHLFNSMHARFYDEIDRRAASLTQAELNTLARLLKKMQAPPIKRKKVRNLACNSEISAV